MTAPAAAAAPGPLRYRVLPVYLLLDTTVPATGGGAAVAGVLPAVRDTWARHPALSDTLRLAVVDLAADAQMRLALDDPLTPGLVVPVLPMRYGVPSGGALVAMAPTIEADVQRLEADGLDVPRPLLWIVTGTAQDDTWRAALDELTASPTRPVVVLCAFGEAASDEARTLLRPGPEGSVTLYAADPATPAEAAVTALTEVLTTALVRTGFEPTADGVVLLPSEDELPGPVTRTGQQRT